jgi:hypothetical protein
MRLSKMAIAGIALMAAAFSTSYLLTSSGLGIDLPPFGIVAGGRGYVLPLSSISFWLLVLAGFFLLAIGMYRSRAR